MGTELDALVALELPVKDLHVAWKMRLEGRPFREIAEHFHVSLETARRWVDEAISRWREGRSAERAELQAVHHERLESAYRELASRLPEAKNPKDAAALATAIGKVLADQRRIWGVDTPEQVNVALLGHVQHEQRHRLLTNDESIRLASIAVERAGAILAGGDSAAVALPSGTGTTDQSGELEVGAASPANQQDSPANHAGEAAG